MSGQFDLEAYLAQGVASTVKEILRASISNPKESLFMAHFALDSTKATKRRESILREEGVHIPPFLICSVTSQCNLHCAGCYARANHACHEGSTEGQLSAEEWGKLFGEAADSGISFILLAGGEPMLRRDVIGEAAAHPEILFPVFTNGTVIDDAYFALLDRARNIIPILSIEGGEAATDNRRGSGVYKKLQETMQRLRENGLVFGASVTVTSANAAEAVSEEFVQMLRDSGCKAVFYVEYVPADGQTPELAPDDAVRERYMAEVARLREQYTDTVFLAFPGDEVASGGCLAAGRGFFHINASGGAEPCPFSPFSDVSIRTHSLREVMQSKLFTALREGGMLTESHSGGCVLFDQAEAVRALIG